MDSVLRTAGECVAKAPARLSLCWPQIGEEFVRGKGLMVVGRATNGWEPAFSSADTRSADRRAQLIADARAHGSAPWDGQPLSWVAHKQNNSGTVGSRSAFWRVTRAMVEQVNGADIARQADWMSHIAWSNIAKVAPAATGNPSSRLLAAQHAACMTALGREIEEIDPGTVLVIAGVDWYAPIVRTLGLRPVGRPTSLCVPTIARTATRGWLFAERPERRSEKVFVSELIAAHGALLAAG